MANDPIHTFSESTIRRIAAAVRAQERTGLNLSSDQRRGRPVVAGSGSNGFLIGKITAVQGTSDQPRYSAIGLNNTAITVINKAPTMRPFASDVAITAAAVGDICYLYRDAELVWQISHVVDEVVTTANCSQQQGQGTQGDMFTSYEHHQRDRFLPAFTGSFTALVTVDNATTNQYGCLLYTFPAGAIRIDATQMLLTASAPTITENIILSVATADATGSTGTTFTAANEDVSENTQSKTLASGGVVYNRLNPAVSTGAADKDNLAGLRDGTTTTGDPIALYLNLGTTGSGWTADEVVTIQGDFSLDWVNMGDG